MAVEVRHLRLIQELHATGSATNAAARLGVTQSAVSHQLRELEVRLNTPVCIRAGKRLVLTPAGHRLLQTADHVLAELAQVMSDVSRLRGGHAGTLRVCAACHTSYQWLPPLLRTFEARHPHVEIDVSVQHTSDPIAALIGGTLDIGLVTDTVHDRRLRVRRLGADEHVAIVPPKHPLAGKPFITPSELGEQDLLLYSASAEESFTVRRILRPAGVRPARIRFVQLTEAIVEMVKAGLGVSVLPSWSVQSAIASRKVRAVRITRDGIRREWKAVSLRTPGEAAYVKDFIDLVGEAIAGLPAPGALSHRKR